MLYIVGMSNVLEDDGHETLRQWEVYLIPMVAVEDPINSYTNILY
jgi:hypothetical protein